MNNETIAMVAGILMAQKPENTRQEIKEVETSEEREDRLQEDLLSV